MKGVLFFGGSFDPVHLGHLSIALQVNRLLPDWDFWFVPCYQSPFKEPPYFEAAKRLRFLEKALRNFPQFKIWDYELKRAKISYTVDSVRYFKKVFKTPLCLILGLDALISLVSWREWESILAQANLIIIKRGGADVDRKMEQFIAARQIQQKELLLSQTGKIYFSEVVVPPIASRRIRQALNNQEQRWRRWVPTEIVPCLQAVQNMMR